MRSRSRRSRLDRRADFSSSSRNASVSPRANSTRWRSTKSRTWSRRYSNRCCSRSPRSTRAGSSDLALCLDLALQRAQAHAIQDAAGIEILLSEEADVLQPCVACGLFHGGGQGGAVVGQQQFAKSGAAATAHALAARHRWRRILCGRGGGGRFLLIRRSEFVTLEVQIEAFVEQVLFVRRLRQHQAERVLQHGAVGETNDVDGPGRVDAFRGRNAQPRAARDLQEAAQRFAGGGAG